MAFCEGCIQNKSLCIKCKRNPIYLDLKDYRKEYEPICPFGYTDCVYDPAYIKLNHPSWYEKLYGNKTPEEVGCSCHEGSGYDDEDK